MKSHSWRDVQLCVLCYQHELGKQHWHRWRKRTPASGSISVYKGEYLKLMALVDGGVAYVVGPMRPMTTADARR